MPDAFHTPEEAMDDLKITLHDLNKRQARIDADIRRHNFHSLVTMTLCMCVLLLGGVLALQEADRVMQREALINQEALAWNR